MPPFGNFDYQQPDVFHFALSAVSQRLYFFFTLVLLCTSKLTLHRYTVLCCKINYTRQWRHNASFRWRWDWNCQVLQVCACLKISTAAVWGFHLWFCPVWPRIAFLYCIIWTVWWLKFIRIVLKNSVPALDKMNAFSNTDTNPLTI
jgi:hypothetical protein